MYLYHPDLSESEHNKTALSLNWAFIKVILQHVHNCLQENYKKFGKTYSFSRKFSQHVVLIRLLKEFCFAVTSYIIRCLCCDQRKTPTKDIAENLQILSSLLADGTGVLKTKIQFYCNNLWTIREILKFSVDRSADFNATFTPLHWNN